MENALTELMDAIVPELNKLLSDLGFWLHMALLVGPVMMLIFGLYYFFLSPKEANHRAGYRTYFGMGSVPAWQFTQKLAGIAWGGLGLLLTIAMIIVWLVTKNDELQQSVSTALTCLIIQACAVLVAFLTVEIMVFLKFDKDGNPKR